MRQRGRKIADRARDAGGEKQRGAAIRVGREACGNAFPGRRKLALLEQHGGQQMVQGRLERLPRQSPLAELPRVLMPAGIKGRDGVTDDVLGLGRGHQGEICRGSLDAS
jgi:hypothetical protein